ncbi:MAG: transposase [Acidobacteriia bacterium]|nr:transposase [Terriglobia bacterium]
MPRIARVVALNVPHHVTLRGNDQQDVFHELEDYQFYLGLLEIYLQKFNVELLGFCLMTNHIHEILVPHEEDSLAKALCRIHSRYAQYVNLRFGRSGHLWEDRFFSCPLDEPHLWTALSYVERNPVRAGIVAQAWDYPWSSAVAHVTGQDSMKMLNMDLWESTFSPARWQQLLERDDDPLFRRRLAQATLRGRPCGSDRFIAEIESELSRQLHISRIEHPRRKVSWTNG